MEIGDWGKAKFVAEKDDWKAPTECYGFIKAITDTVITFEDHNEKSYQIKKENFNFEKGIFKNLNE